MVKFNKKADTELVMTKNQEWILYLLAGLIIAYLIGKATGALG